MALSSFRPLVLLLMIAAAPAAEIHVAAAGNPGGSGHKDAPLRSLAAARNAARKFAGKETVTIHVAEGIYYLPETLVLDPADSGSAAFPVIYQSDSEGKAVISGGMRLALDWRPHRNGIYQAIVPAGLSIDQLFINGKRQHMARYPNFDPAKSTAAYQGFAADAFSKERAARWADPAGGFMHAMHAQRWGGYHYRITGKNPDGSVAYVGGWQNNRQMGMHAEFRMVENIFEELDARGEWFFNPTTQMLYLLPEPGNDLAAAEVEIVRLRHLVEFKGSVQSPVEHITFKGFTFRHAARTFMDTKEPLLRSDWAIYRGGAVVLTGTKNVSLLDNEFDQLGGNAIFVNCYNRGVLVKGCHIHDAGASGVCFVGDPQAVRDPLFEYAQTLDLGKIDRTPGPRNDNYPADSTVEDCLIHGIGRVERQPAGVQISMAYRISVKDCSIYDCARSGINIGDGCWGGHLIEGCDVFDTVLETHDHGSFNSWGRDRFWASDHRNISEPEVRKDPRLPYLDAMKTTIIRDSRWRCDHGWDIDLDDGSGNYEIYNNLLLGGGLKFREGYGRKAYNNVLAGGGFHPHVWFTDSDSEFSRNIVMKPHAPVGQPGDWGKHVNENLFITEAARALHLESGADTRSLSGDPMFINPAAGNFEVRPDSPAINLGFQNFPMDRFGVKKPSLRALAKTPVIPETGASAGSHHPVAGPESFWLGARLHALEGEEFSAFGVRKEEGGVQLVEVPADSAAARAGFHVNDLLLEMNRRKVMDIPKLHSAILEAGAGMLDVRLVRNQQVMVISHADSPFVLIDSASSAKGFTKLPLRGPVSVGITTNRLTHDDPLSILTDGTISAGYGPVFGNRVSDGMYKMDLGTSHEVVSITSWSFALDGRRGRQNFTIFGSDSLVDPGWETSDNEAFRPLASIDTQGSPDARFIAASLESRPLAPLGKFRWIVWKVTPINTQVENTAFQEFNVAVSKAPPPERDPLTR